MTTLLISLFQVERSQSLCELITFFQKYRSACGNAVAAWRLSLAHVWAMYFVNVILTRSLEAAETCSLETQGEPPKYGWTTTSSSTTTLCRWHETFLTESKSQCADVSIKLSTGDVRILHFIMSSNATSKYEKYNT